MAVTLYDLVPDIFPDWYLQDPGLRRRWRCGREVVRVADAVLTLSEVAKQDAMGMLGVPGRRVSVIGSATSPVFHPPRSRKQALRQAREAVEALEPGAIVYNGAFNPRKNVDRLVEAYASLPQGLVKRHQLVIVCEAPALTRNHYLVMAEDLGVAGRLLIPGYLPEEGLVSLLQSAELAVFPSLYEGYGLPVVEAMACGTPAIAGDNSSLREILPAEARFDASDTAEIAAAMERALTDPGYRERLIDLARQPPPTWAAVADRAAAVFEQLLARPRALRPGWPRRPRLALVAAPPELVASCEALASCDLLTASEALSTGTYARRLDALRGGYDAVVAWAPGLGAPLQEAIERLAVSWPGQAMAVLGATAPTDGAAPFDTGLSGTGLHEGLHKARAKGVGPKTVKAASSWDETARRVVDAARAPCP
jgi:hypothetical protein